MTAMSTGQLFEAAKKRLVYVTNRPPIVMERGEGMYLFDSEGKRYLDFVGGWAVTSLGHCPPVLVNALKKQAEILVNCSPGFFNRGMIAFADLLVRHSCFDQAWFGNTGAEVNEAAIKMARKFGTLHKTGAYEIITTEHSSHGRTLATMSATGKPQWAALFEPKAGGFIHVAFNDLQALQQTVSEKTIAIIAARSMTTNVAAPTDPVGIPPGIATRMPRSTIPATKPPATSTGIARRTGSVRKRTAIIGGPPRVR